MIQVNIPSIVSNSPYIIVESPTPYGTINADFVLSLESDVLEMLVQIIKDKEMAQVMKENPTVDFDKISEMINSGDPEMRGLGLNLIKTYTYYTYKLLIAPNYSSSDTFFDGSRESIVREYLRKNKNNITNKVWI